MRVGVTTDADKQGRVIHVGAAMLVEPGPLRESQRDQALAQNMLHRLPKSKIHAEREGRHELSQPEMRAVAPVSHRFLLCQDHGCAWPQIG